MNSAREQDTRSTYRNLLHFFTLTMKHQKRKVNKKTPFEMASKKKGTRDVRYNLMTVANTAIPYIRK